MRKISVGMFVSLDGVMEGPGPSDDYPLAGWTMPYHTEEVDKVIMGNMMSADALLLGRVTYKSFEGAFSGGSGVFEDYMNNQAKYVVSTTMQKPDWKNTTLIKGNVVEQITKLKEQPGKNISVTGSATLLQTLIKHDLVDEYSLLVYPVVLGMGKRLFQDGNKTTLKLVKSEQLGSGVVHLLYEPVRGK